MNTLSWDACTLEPNAFIRWLECHPGAANWGAAIFGGLAVLVAVCGGLAAWLIENRRIRARGRVAAFRLNLPIIAIYGEAGQAIRLISGLIEEAKKPFPALPFSIERHLAVSATIPADVFNESWTLPPQIALATAQLDTQLSRQPLWLDNLDAIFIAAKVEQRVALLKAAEVQLNAIMTLANEVKGHVNAVCDVVARAHR